MVSSSTFSIPRPCAKSWAAMAPTADGRHCAACHTEVVDFTKLSEAEILAYLAARPGSRPVCAYVHASQLGPVPASRWRRWLLAGLAVLGWSVDASAQPPSPVPQPVAAEGENAPPTAPVIVRGQVCDDHDGLPVSGARVLIKGTEYGATTDSQGRFELVMAATWAPLSSGVLALHVEGSPFAFKPQDIQVKVRGRGPGAPIELSITLQSIPDRGRVMGKIRMPEPPVVPPRQ